MAKDDDQDEDSKVLVKLERSAKTIRVAFISLLIVSSVLASILLTGLLVLNLQLASRREVPSEDFAEQLALLESYRQHLVSIHNAEAKAYYEFQDTLTLVTELYEHERINELRRFMTERERDHRKLLSLMMVSVDSLAQMQSGSRDWTQAYAEQVEAASKRSEEQEKRIKQSMVLPVATGDDEDQTATGKDGTTAKKDQSASEQKAR